MADKGGYLIRDQQAVHFLTFTVVQWIDIFTRYDYAEIIVESLKFCQKNKGLRIHAWCIMSNHVHIIASAAGNHSLSDIIRDFKKYTSQQIIQAIQKHESESRKNWMLWIFKHAGAQNTHNENFQFWQHDSHPVECSTRGIFESRMAYVHANPVKARRVRSEEQYVYSSGIDYYGEGKGLIDIDFIEGY